MPRTRSLGLFAALLVCSLFILILNGPMSASAQQSTMTVGAGAVSVVDDDVCSLREAVVNAQADRQTYDDCPIGVPGLDVITLPAGQYDLADSPIDLIVTPIRIDGAGAADTIIDANGPRHFEIAEAGDLTITGMTLTGAAGSQSGGAVLNNGRLTVIASALTGNSTTIVGGAIANNGTATISDSAISDNSSTAGGAISNSGTLNIVRSTLDGNTAVTSTQFLLDADGGAIRNSGPDANLAIYSSTLSNNTSVRSGGAITNGGATPTVRWGNITLVNSTLSGNTAGTYGGGIYSAGVGVNITIANSTLAGNMATTYGSAYYVVRGSTFQGEVGPFVTFQNSVIQASTDPDAAGSCQFVIDVVSTATNSLTDDPSCGDGATGMYGLFPVSDSLNLGPLQDNGGPTLTHRPGAGSALIAAADRAFCETSPVNGIDQTGAARVTDGSCDIGAVEATGTAIVTAIMTAEGPFLPDETITFTVVLANSGTANQADNPTDEFVVTLPAELTLVEGGSASSGTLTPNLASNTVEWNGAIDAGTSVTITFSAAISGDAAGETIAVQGDVFYDADANGSNESTGVTDDPAGGTATDPTTFLVLAPDLAVSKTITSTGPYGPGDAVTYQIGLQNLMPVPALGTTLTDVLPAGLAYTSIDTPDGWQCQTPAVGAGGTVTCTADGVAAGADLTFTLTAAVANSAPDASTIRNSASVSTTSTELSTGNNEGTSGDITVAYNLDVAISLTDSPDPVGPGAALDYTVTVTNNGDPAGVGFTFTPDANTTVQNVEAPTGWECATVAPFTCAASASGWTSPAVITVYTTVGSTVADGATLSASVSGTSYTGPSDDHVQEESLGPAVATTTVVYDLDVSLALLDTPDPIGPGNVLTYTVTATNNGDAAGAEFTVTPDSLTSILPDQITAPVGWTCIPLLVTSQVRCSTTSPTWASPATISIQVAVGGSVPDGTTLYAAASGRAFIGDSLDPDREEAIAQISESTLVAYRIEVTAEKTALSTVRPGADIPYTLTITNTGDAANLSFTDTLPPGTLLDPLSLTVPDGWECPPIASPGQFTCATSSPWPPELPAVFTYEVTTDFMAEPNIVLTNTVTGAATTAVQNVPFTAKASTRIAPLVALTFTKTPNKSEVSQGETVTYTVRLTNRGDVLHRAIITDALPAGLTLQSASVSPPGYLTCDGTTTLTCTAPVPILPSQSITLTIVAKVNAGVADGTTLRNEARLQHAAGATTARAAQVKVVTPQDLAVDVALATVGARAGDTVRYNFTVTNTAPDGRAEDATLVIQLPANTTFTSIDGPTKWICSTRTNVVTCKANTVQPGEVAHFELRVRLAGNATGQVTLQANVSSDRPDPVSNNNVDSVRFTVR